MHRADGAHWAAQSRGPAACAPRSPAANPARLPFAVVRTAIHVQHLPGDVARFGEIDPSRVADVAVYQHELVGTLQPSRLCCIARCADHVMATFQERLDYRGADSLRGARHDYSLLS